MTATETTQTTYPEERPRQPLLRRFAEAPPQLRIGALIVVLWLVAAAIWTTLLPGSGPLQAPVQLTWPILALLFFVAERFVVDLEVREQTHSFSVSEIALILGLIFAAPLDLLVGQAIGSGIALALRPGQRPIKLLFNIGNFAVTTTVAIVIFRLVVGTADPIGPLGWIGAFGAALACDLLAATNVALVIWLSRYERPNAGSLFGFATLYTVVAAGVALIAATVLWHAPQASWLLVLLAVMMFLALRFHGREMRRHRSVSRLHESTRRIQESFSLDEVSGALLATAQEMFEGATAELLLFPESGDTANLLRVSDDQPLAWTEYRLDPHEGVWARISAEGRGLIIHDGRGRSRQQGLDSLVRRIRSQSDETAERVLAHFRSRGIRGAMVAPIRVDEAVVGTLLIANRRGSTTDWTGGDLTLLETLANHAGVALQNSRQADELAHQRDELERRATHDSLTALPNRLQFKQQLTAAVASSAAKSGSGGAVLLLDLDRFKEVNDTLGHHNGDRLLVEVALRLAERFRDPNVVARFGGDEFAILLRDTELGGIIAAAEQTLDVFQTPFVVQGVSVQVETSIGICRFPEHGDDADTLLRRADVAMYEAKTGHKLYAIYEPQRDPYSEARLALLSELKRAIEMRELTVAYQPQVSPKTGRIEAVEALVRWRHPQRGELLPDEFVGLAERSEVIHELTRFVLDTAIKQCAEWRQDGHNVRVAVNLSARSLHDTTLADKIDELLTRHKVDAAALELEITETSIEADPAGTNALLERLHSMGVGISIDDFGTGYSAFSYLQRLPIEEIKIDRSFVIGMDSDKRKGQIVRSTIQLGHNLGLRVVAEGVETEAVARQLTRLGSDLLQGFHIGRPVSADLVGGLLRRPPRVPSRSARSSAVTKEPATVPERRLA